MPFVEYDEIEAVCSECGMIFRSEEALEAHRERTHAPSRAVAPRTPRPPKPRGTARRP